MKTLLRAIQFVFFASLAVCVTAAEDDFKNIALLNASAKTAQKVVVYGGVGRGFRPTPETKVVAKGLYRFYPKANELTEDEVKAVLKVFSQEDGFEAYRGPKKCGGFHPDVCVEWTVDGKTTVVLFCFTCHEIKAVGPDYKLHCDIRGEAYKTLHALLNKFGPPEMDD